MLCLKAQVVEDDPRASRSQAGVFLPINLPSSIHRYLRKNGRGGSHHSFSSSGDGSGTSSGLEDRKPWERESSQESRGRTCLYKFQLEQDVKELQKQLQEEIDLNLALASAAEHSSSPFSDSFQLPAKAQELLDSIAVLEITVSKLEQKLVALNYQLTQERNERRLSEYHLRHFPHSVSSGLHCCPAHSTKMIIEPYDGDGEDEEMDDLPLWLDVNEDPSNDYFVENLWHHPNQLSEEMVQCMRDIFLFLADSSKLSSSEGVASPRGHLSYSSLASFSDSSILASLVRSPSVDLHNVSEIFARDGMFDPYSIPGKVDWTRSIGTYSMAAEVSWMSVGKKQLEYAAGAFKRFRLLVEQLARVNLSCMSCIERMAFWINLYNALIMHAYLAYGVPTSDIKLFSLMQKAAYTVGGHSFNAVDIEFIVLKMKPPAHRPQIVRIFKPGNVNETLKKSLKDYVQASVGISNKGKLLVPKFLYCFAKGIVEDSLLPEWICQFLSPEQAAVVRDCSSNPKRRLLSARSFSILSFDSRFRYLFLLEDRTLPKRHGVNGND
ncbi:uncharacterized protein LOC117925221 isoform X3 [Vitis riparia]|uniref:uncharacterized protein LOC117925221 isoform X3 n=1 Tax=Vitis riparia TaxID=96939 RepID=UPI00155A3970|nr:uncharacterized protein LOC117925221 isoform X3 [Vitis riparia]